MNGRLLAIRLAGCVNARQRFVAVTAVIAKCVLQHVEAQDKTGNVVTRHGLPLGSTRGRMPTAARATARARRNASL
jgi:hypothetical protein